MKSIEPLEKAIEYIEAHLTEPIGLADVSQATGYSYYHMTRLFTVALGESVGHYIHRRRLYEASEKLLYSDQRVLDIALEYGFQSAEVFSRSFKAVFGRSPREYRKNGVNLLTQAKRKLVPEDVEHIANHISHTPDIVERDTILLVGQRGTTTLFDNRIPDLWQQFLNECAAWVDASTTGYSVCETLSTVYTQDGDTSFSVFVGAADSDFTALPYSLNRKTLMGGKFAVFTHHGALSRLAKTYLYIYGTWLPGARYQLDSREDFEVYTRPVVSPDDPANEVKLFIPIQ